MFSWSLFLFYFYCISLLSGFLKINFRFWILECIIEYLAVELEEVLLLLRAQQKVRRAPLRFRGRCQSPPLRENFLEEVGSRGPFRSARLTSVTVKSTSLSEYQSL